MIAVESLSARPELVADVVEIAWREWGSALGEEEHTRWLREAERDCRLNNAFSAGFVAIADGVAIGTVQLHGFDIDAMRDRSPWVCGMVVRPEYRGKEVGRRLLTALESFAQAHAVERLWVFTEDAAAFYEACGWEPFGESVQDGVPGIVLTKAL